MSERGDGRVQHRGSTAGSSLTGQVLRVTFNIKEDRSSSLMLKDC